VCSDQPTDRALPLILRFFSRSGRTLPQHLRRSGPGPEWTRRDREAPPCSLSSGGALWLAKGQRRGIGTIGQQHASRKASHGRQRHHILVMISVARSPFLEGQSSISALCPVSFLRSSLDIAMSRVIFVIKNPNFQDK